MYNYLLDTFIVVVKTGSFTKASEELFISSTSIMKQMNKLENDLHLKLFQRTPQGVELTLQGKYIYKKATELIYLSHNIIHEASGIMDKYTETRNVAGELKATVEAINWAIKQGYSKVYIHYDYEGIEKWTTGEWKAKNNISRLYVDYIARIKDTIILSFIKVKCNIYNEMANNLAAKAAFGRCTNKRRIS